MIVKVSVALSLDGFLDDASPERLRLSSTEDWAEVEQLRAGCDAILVGAGTVRKDNPSLVLKTPELCAQRERQGMTGQLIKVTLSESGDLDPSLRFFTEGSARKIVIVGASASEQNRKRLQKVAEVVVCDVAMLSPVTVVGILEERGIKSLLIEGGCRILTQFLSDGQIDYLRIAQAPFFVGDAHAPRFVLPAGYLHDKQHRMLLWRVSKVGDMAVAEYLPRINRDELNYLEQAVALSESSPKSDTAYSVGAVIVTTEGEVFTGYSRETAPNNHAEEEAIQKALQANANLSGAAIYTSMEPCSTRKSKEKSCSRLIVENGLQRVVFATYEPAAFVSCSGEKLLQAHGISVAIVDVLRERALTANKHILQP